MRCGLCCFVLCFLGHAVDGTGPHDDGAVLAQEVADVRLVLALGLRKHAHAHAHAHAHTERRESDKTSCGFGLF